MKAFFYIGLAGCGWLLDLALFWSLVSAGTAPGLANLVSASIAAMTVYLLAQRLLFLPAVFSWRRFLTYLAYTEANIVLWALAIQSLSSFLWHNGILDNQHAASVLAKVLVTPLSMAGNFVVTRILSGRQHDAR